VCSEVGFALGGNVSGSTAKIAAWSTISRVMARLRLAME
jgi:hypothetical protein